MVMTLMEAWLSARADSNSVVRVSLCGRRGLGTVCCVCVEGEGIYGHAQGKTEGPFFHEGTVIPSLPEVNVLTTLINSRSTSRMVLRWPV